VTDFDSRASADAAADDDDDGDDDDDDDDDDHGSVDANTVAGCNAQPSKHSLSSWCVPCMRNSAGKTLVRHCTSVCGTEYT